MIAYIVIAVCSLLVVILALVDLYLYRTHYKNRLTKKAETSSPAIPIAPKIDPVSISNKEEEKVKIKKQKTVKKPPVSWI